MTVTFQASRSLPRDPLLPDDRPPATVADRPSATTAERDENQILPTRRDGSGELAALARTAGPKR